MKKIIRKVKKISQVGCKKAKKNVFFPFVLGICRFFESSYRTAAVIIIPFLLILIFLDYHVFISLKEINWISVIARVHGIFFDIILLGLFLLIVEAIRGRKRKIRKYREQLEDIFFWNEKEGILKKAGIIKRLSKLGAKITELSGCVLADANLSDINLESATLEGADLTGAKLNDALLNRTVLSRYAVASKQEIVLSMENKFTRLTGAELNHVQLCDAECACIDFSRIQMMHAKLNRTNLRNSVFHGAILRFTEMKDARLEDADFSEADLYRVTFRGANLQGALFSRNKDKKWKNSYSAQLNHANFEKANLNGAVMDHVDLSHAFFKSASMMNIKLSFAYLGWASLENTLLIDADLHGADVSNTIFKNASLAGANLRDVKNLTLDQLKDVKTLYQASLDDELFQAITKNGYNHLFKWAD